MSSHTVARWLVGRLCEKVAKNRDDIVMSESFYTEDADALVLAYGSVARPAHEAVLKAREMGKRVGFFRPVSLWPSPDREILAAAEKVKTVIIPEMNCGQYAMEVCRIFGEAGHTVKVVKLNELGSEFIHPDRICNLIQEVC
jgi:2-oxoglutarate ferredoxin oxidoreductase subunit alpha